ncbi:hypothetical protein CE91St62_36820 [Lachnospiraceae bacterium]|uniref:hypothetical protein n=1 Tax=Extibacter sp. GGCC_0201 TaxID=2731209 RepID=UPI001AA15029|nr:hypothetical protein [Extibacter sp. GGCC_0201]MBO1719957.1 hypothetical protein [Extibacter sp. GGCC_0201]BDF35619.1 hypothetical protein CE91St61_36940 [Lachnospiraceae bacterium]BDF39621.1 hypothetical protein CE91St62_36820 [Lachnospiraceae bacterium]
MLDLTFGEQVKIILSRKGMTIKELAETIEERTGKKMSRQNLTQRLGRDNFQEQDMRMIADILECPFTLSILEEKDSLEKASNNKKEEKKPTSQRKPEARTEEEKEEEKIAKPVVPERDITIGELVEIHEELDALIEEETGELAPLDTPVEELLKEVAALEAEGNERTAGDKRDRLQEQEDKKSHGWISYLQRRRKKPEQSAAGEIESKDDEDGFGVTASYADQEETYMDAGPEEEAEEMEDVDASYVDYDGEEAMDEMYVEPEVEYDDEDRVNGDVNPYTGREYETNSVRMHPNRIGYVQVYDREDHAWTDMTEWAFLGYQERKKALLGKDYEPPIYLD